MITKDQLKPGTYLQYNSETDNTTILFIDKIRAVNETEVLVDSIYRRPGRIYSSPNHSWSSWSIVFITEVPNFTRITQEDVVEFLLAI